MKEGIENDPTGKNKMEECFGDWERCIWGRIEFAKEVKCAIIFLGRKASRSRRGVFALESRAGTTNELNTNVQTFVQ